MRRFNLIRNEDVSGVSGVGVVAEGVEFHDGKVCLSWFGKHHCEAIWDTILDMLEVHGHEGRTTVVWVDEEEL